MTQPTTTYLAAVRDGLDEELARDERVVLIGEDLRVWGGPYGACKGLAEKYPDRVLSTPISEGAFVGAAVGAAATGLRPVVELMFSDFLGVCLDPLMNGAAKLRYVSGGQFAVPLVVRTTVGVGQSLGATHCQSLYATLAHIPGLVVVTPATPADAKGLLKSAIRSNDPVVIFEHKLLYFRPRGVVGRGETLVPIGVAAVCREGNDLTIVAISRGVQLALKAAQVLDQRGISVEVVDPRTVAPLDLSAVAASVRKTRRLLVVDEATPFGSVGSEVIAQVSQKAFGDLADPPVLCASAPAPVPFAPSLERAYAPTVDAIVAAAVGMVDG